MAGAHKKLKKVKKKAKAGEGGAAPLRARKRQFAREAIWDAAIGLFAEKGFEETTVEEIAEAAGTSRRTFFRYFDSKSDLLAQAIVDFEASLREAILGCGAKDPAEALKEAALRTARHSAAQPRTRRIMEIAAKQPAARAAQAARAAELQERVARAYAERLKGGDGVMAQVMAGLTLTVLSAAFRRWFERGEKDIGAAVERALEAAREAVCGERRRGKRGGAA